MTAAALTYRQPGRLKLWPLLLAVVLAATLAIPQAVESTHASLHSEANYIRQCASSPENLLQVWVNQPGSRVNCLIDLGNGVVGNYILQWCEKSRWVEITAFIIGDGELREAINYLQKRACTQVWP
jgi:hypothetical protein